MDTPESIAQAEACDTAEPKKIFGEEFAWAVFTVTVAYTYSIITLVQYLA
jgi:hypothetical protein